MANSYDYHLNVVCNEIDAATDANSDGVFDRASPVTDLGSTCIGLADGKNEAPVHKTSIG